MRRREFLSSTVALAATGLAPRSARASDAVIEILIDEPIGEIAPEIYGHFTEHLGGVIYDGIWVGEDSKVPNVNGIRKSLVDRMRQLHTPVVRWPGGCFADSYDWRDGTGPRSSRPTRTNFWLNTRQLQEAPDGPQKYEPNTFGTAEFIRFCQLCGAKPYLAGNVRSLTPIDFDQWVEYCNSPAGSTTLAKRRAGDGGDQPFGVTYWGIGNESWGCGGNFRPEEYAAEFRRFTSWAPDYGLKLRFVASGPGAAINDPQVQWTRGFFEGLTGKGPGMLRRLYGLSMHYYCWTAGKGQSVDFTVDDWYQLLRQADVMDSLITQHWQAMGEFDKQHRVKLIVDEWGAWHRGLAIDPRYLFSYVPTMRDALVTAITLDTFNRHAEKLAMCNVAQLVNCIHTLFLAREDKFAVTPIFHVFDMYQAHQGGRSLRLVVDAPEISDAAGKSFWGLAGSASLHGKTLVVTVANPHVSQARTADVTVRGGSARSCRATVLASPDIHAHNDFENGRAVEPQPQPASAAGSTFSWVFRPASVTKLEIELV